MDSSRTSLIFISDSLLVKVLTFSKNEDSPWNNSWSTSKRLLNGFYNILWKNYIKRWDIVVSIDKAKLKIGENINTFVEKRFLNM